MDTNSLQQSQLDTPHKLALNPIKLVCCIKSAKLRLSVQRVSLPTSELTI